MLLNNIFLGFLFIIAVYFDKIKIQVIMFIFLLCFSVINFLLGNQEFKLKKIKIIFYFLLFSFITQFFYSNEGKILFSVFGFHISENGILHGAIITLRILNMIILAGNLKIKMTGEKNEKFKFIFNTVLKFSPEVIILFKKKFNINKIFRILMIKTYREILRLERKI